MPAPVPYTPRRRMVMTVLMWLVLGVTVAGAAALSHWKSGQWNVRMQAASQFGPLQVALPQGWQVSIGNEQEHATVTAREAGANGRTVTIQATEPNPSFDALLRLLNAGRVPDFEFAGSPIRDLEQIEVPGGEGLIFHLDSIGRRGASVAMAYVRFDSGQAATVELENPGRRTSSDEAVVYSIAKSLRAVGGWRPVHEPTRNEI